MNADILAQTSGTALAACGILAQRSGLEKKTDQIINSGQENENLNSVASSPHTGLSWLMRAIGIVIRWPFLTLSLTSKKKLE